MTRTPNKSQEFLKENITFMGILSTVDISKNVFYISSTLGPLCDLINTGIHFLLSQDTQIGQDSQTHNPRVTVPFQLS